jgi:hypothetical protein
MWPYFNHYFEQNYDQFFLVFGGIMGPNSGKMARKPMESAIPWSRHSRDSTSFPPLKVLKVMTLEPYDPDRLDRLALRLLDLCGRVRGMARQSRDEELARLELHDRKALEFLDRFEEWLYKAEADLARAVMRNRGQRLARSTQGGRPK